MEQRRDKVNYYLDIAQTVSERSTCLRRKFGAIIVKNDQIISTGYVGAPRGRENCCDMGYCLRSRLQIPHGERYELCRSVHAEQNAIIAASRNDMIGADLYLACLDYETNALVAGTNSCSLCKRFIINAGIQTVYVRDTADSYRVINVQSWIENDESLTGQRGY